MKLTKEQLRGIIREAVERKLEEAGPPSQSPIGAELNEMGDALGALVADIIADEQDRIITMFLENNPNDDMVRPTREEDVAAFAETVVHRAIAFGVRNALTNAVETIFHELMNPE